MYEAAIYENQLSIMVAIEVKLIKKSKTILNMNATALNPIYIFISHFTQVLSMKL